MQFRKEAFFFLNKRPIVEKFTVGWGLCFRLLMFRINAYQLGNQLIDH